MKAGAVAVRVVASLKFVRETVAPAYCVWHHDLKACPRFAIGEKTDLPTFPNIANNQIKPKLINTEAGLPWKGRDL